VRGTCTKTIRSSSAGTTARCLEPCMKAWNRLPLRRAAPLVDVHESLEYFQVPRGSY
jgi:hypothetical protein